MVTLKLISAFNALNTFKTVSMVALLALLSNLEICAFCTPTSAPSSFRIRNHSAAALIRVW